MPRELITIQVGQCGNQVGCKFWEMALKEHAAANPKGLFDEAMSSFFRNVDLRYEDPLEIPVGDGTGLIRSLKARAVIVDMEEGVVNATLQGPLGELFDSRQFLTDVSGSGNNWAHGHDCYGPKYRECLLSSSANTRKELLEKIRRPVEFCDSLQSFLLLHSMGGGTGSGLGTYLLELLADNFPDVYRFASVVFPSADDDVITSPYNSVLAIEQLNQHADCVLPVDNAALLEMIQKADRTRTGSGVSTVAAKMTSKSGGIGSKKGSSSSGGGSSSSASRDIESRPFDTMNNVISRLLLSLTASMRFPGSLNTDLNEITMNLVPFPRLNFLLSSCSPLLGLSSTGSAVQQMGPRRLEASFLEPFDRDHQMLQLEPRHRTYLAAALLGRGAMNISDVNRAIGKLKPTLKMVAWNPDGFKVGLCDVPPVGAPHSVLCLANNTAITTTFDALAGRFVKLWSRKAHIHHYTEYMEEDRFNQALEHLTGLSAEYAKIDGYCAPDVGRGGSARKRPVV